MIFQSTLLEVASFVNDVLTPLIKDPDLRKEQELDEEHINWEGLRCADVIACRNTDNDMWVRIVIHEASPEARLFRMYLLEQLAAYFLDLEFEITMEW